MSAKITEVKLQRAVKPCWPCIAAQQQHRVVKIAEEKTCSDFVVFFADILVPGLVLLALYSRSAVDTGKPKHAFFATGAMLLALHGHSAASIWDSKNHVEPRFLNVWYDAAGPV